MSQPPDDPYYTNPSESTSWSQRWPGQQPVNNQTQPPGPDYPGPGGPPRFPPQGPGYPPQAFPPNGGSNSQSGFYAPNSGPTYPPQAFPPNGGQNGQSGFYTQDSGQVYPPNSGPNSQPGFAPGAGAYPPPNSGPVGQPGFSSPGASASGWQNSGNAASTYTGGQSQQGYQFNQGGFNAFQAPPAYPAPGGGFQPTEVRGGLPNWQEQRQPPKRSNKGLLVISIVVIVVLLVGGLSTFLVLRAKNKNAGSNSITTNAQNTPTTSGVTPVATATTGPVSGNGVGTIGTPIQAGSSWIVTVTKTQENTTSVFPPKAGDAFLEVSVTVKNISAQQQDISSLLEFSLTDANGGKFSESVSDSNVHATLEASVPAGQTQSGQIAYEVPQSLHSFNLIFDYGLLSGGSSTIIWQLHV